MIKEPIPAVDLVICRDLFGHFRNNLVRKAVDNLKQSGSKLLLTTTFPKTAQNVDLYATGAFRRINLQAPPFNFPEPVASIVEDPTTGKTIGLWRFEDIP